MKHPPKIISPGIKDMMTQAQLFHPGRPIVGSFAEADYKSFGAAEADGHKRVIYIYVDKDGQGVTGFVNIDALKQMKGK